MGLVFLMEYKKFHYAQKFMVPHHTLNPCRMQKHEIRTLLLHMSALAKLTEPIPSVIFAEEIKDHE